MERFAKGITIWVHSSSSYFGLPIFWFGLSDDRRVRTREALLFLFSRSRLFDFCILRVSPFYRTVGHTWLLQSWLAITVLYFRGLKTVCSRFLPPTPFSTESLRQLLWDQHPNTLQRQFSLNLGWQFVIIAIDRLHQVAP